LFKLQLKMSGVFFLRHTVDRQIPVDHDQITENTGCLAAPSLFATLLDVLVFDNYIQNVPQNSARSERAARCAS